MDGLPLLDANGFLWRENQRLREQLQQVREQLRQRQDCSRQLQQLERRCDQLRHVNHRLRQRVAELTERLNTQPHSPPPPPSPPPPAWVKPNTRRRHRKRPGRKPGHAPAVRAKPAAADVHRDLPLPVDARGKVSCPHCNTQLSNVRGHERWVQDIIPSRTITTCYHTTSGYCPCCRKTIESRADEQPPPADLPHAQLGLGVLSIAALMRICYRMPLRQITRLFAHLPGMQLCPGAIVKQLKRLSTWLEKQYHRLKLVLRAAGVVHADETGWRTDGHNGYLWTLTNARHTLYHIDRSRSAKVIVELLGKSFGTTGDQTLVSDFYSVYDQFTGPQQKCLAHLLRELRDTVAKRPELAAHEFFGRCKRLIQQMLKLKTQRPSLSQADYTRRVDRIEKRLDELARMDWGDPDAERLNKRLYKHRQKLTTFLHKDQVDGTNNAAERAIRPAVVMRKITGGSRSESGAKAWSILASVMRSAEQQGRDVLETIKTLLKAQWAGKDITLLTD